MPLLFPHISASHAYDARLGDPGGRLSLSVPCIFQGLLPTAMSAVFNFTFVPWFRSVAPYIHKFRNQTFVIGLTGEAIAAGQAAQHCARLGADPGHGVKIVLVHGFRPQVNEQLAAKGHAAKYSHGIRITDSVALDCAQEAAGQLRYEIEAAFSQGCQTRPWRRHGAGNFRQLSHRTARGHCGWGGFPALWPGAQGGCGRYPAHAGHGRWCCCRPLVFPTGEAFNLSMEEVGHQRGD